MTSPNALVILIYSLFASIQGGDVCCTGAFPFLDWRAWRGEMGGNGGTGSEAAAAASPLKDRPLYHVSI